MKKELLIYSSIWSYNASVFIEQMNELSSEDVRIRINTPGGSVTDGFGMIAKLKEHKGKKEFQIDGAAYSLGAFLPLFRSKNDSATCLDVSEFLIHRAAWPSWLERDANFFTADKKASLENMNNTLRAGIEAWCTAEEWENVTGTTLDEVFSLDQRLDVILTAQQAKQLGFVDNIVSITPERKAEIEGYAQMIAMASIHATAPQQASKQTLDNHKKNNCMTIEKLKSENPDIYNQIVALGVAKERDRVGAFMAFAHLDIEGVKKSITEGAEMTQTQMAEFVVKATAKVETKKIADNNAPDIESPDDAGKGGGKDANVTAFVSDIEKLTGLKL